MIKQRTNLRLPAQPNLLKHSRRYRGASLAAWALAGLSIAASVAPRSLAATYTWTGTANNNWNNANNWLPAATPNPVAGDIIDASTLDLTANRVLNLNNGTSNADRTAGTWIFGDTNAVDTTTRNWTVGGNGPAGSNPKLILAVTSGTGTIQVNNGTTTINALVAGNQGLAKTGAGTLALTNVANSITGGIFLNGGTLAFATSTLNNNLITTSGAVGLTWSNDTADISNQISLGDGSTLTLTLSGTAGDNTTFATALQVGALGNGGIVKGGASNLTITAANTFTGGTKVNNGRLILSGGDNRLAAGGGLSLGNGANSGVVQLGDAADASSQAVTSLAISGSGTSNSIVGGNAGNSTITINNTANITAANSPRFGGDGALENNLVLVKSGAGNLVLSKANTFAGDVNVQGGAVVVTNATGLGLGAKTVTVSGITNAPSVQLNLAAGLTVPATHSFVTSNDDATVPAIRNTAGDNVIAGNLALSSDGFGGGHTRITVAGGSLTLNGAIAPTVTATSDRTLFLDGANNGTATGLIADSGATKLGITKSGAGAWTLSAANSYSGPTAVNAGQLTVTTAQAGGGTIAVADGATLGVQLIAPGQSLTTSSLTLGSATGASIAFNLGSGGNPTAPVIVTTAFSTSVAGFDTNKLNVAATGLSVGSFDLIAYTGIIGGSGFGGLQLGTLPARVTADLVDDFANSKVKLNVSAFDVPKWTGANGSDWDINDGADPTTGTGTVNWKEANSGNATRYLQISGTVDSVIFDDSAAGSTNVNLTTILTPVTATVNNSTLPYTFSGAGKLSGTTALVKQGIGTLILANTGGNDYTGGTTISGGTIQVGDGITAGAGALGVGLILNNGAIRLNRPDDFVVSSAISGAGSVTKQGVGITTFSGNNSGFTGAITVSTGTLKAGNPNALGDATGATTVQAGAFLDITAVNTPEPVQLNGGAIVATTGVASNASGPITLNGGGILSAPSAVTLTAGNSISGLGGLTKNDLGTAIISGPTSFSGGLLHNAGTTILVASQGYTGGTFVASGTVQIGATNGAGTTGNIGAGDIALNPESGSATLSILRADHFTLANNITSSGAGTNSVSIGVTGATSPSGIVTLSGANTFTGDIAILGGALRITDANVLGVGPKTIAVRGNARPAFQLDGAAGDIVVPAEIGYQLSSDGVSTAVTENSGAIVNIAGNNIINGHIALTNSNGGNGKLSVEAGTLTVNGGVDSTGATNARSLLLGGPGNGVVNGLIADAVFAVNVTKDGAGVWSLTGLNTFTGAVAAQEGTLKVNFLDALGSPQPLGAASSAISLGTANTAGTLEYNGAVPATLNRPITVGGVGGGVVVNSCGHLLTLAGTLTKNGRPLTLTGGNFEVTGPIAGANANSDLIIVGGTTTLTNTTNSYNGPTEVIGGATLRNGAASVLPDNTTVRLGEAVGNTGGTYDVNGFDETIARLVGTGTGAQLVTNRGASGVATLTVTGTSTFGGSIQDGATAQIALSKTTGGTLTLTGASSYTGPTNVSGGALLVSGGISGSTVNVSGTGVVGGSGTIDTANQLFALTAVGAKLSPGVGGPGELTVKTGAAEFDISTGVSGIATAALLFDLGLPGSSDKLSLTTGVLNIGSGLLAFDDFAFTPGVGFGPGTYTLFQTVNGIAGTLDPEFANLEGVVGEFAASLSLTGQEIVLNVIPVPEPSIATSMLGGMALLVGLRRRRR